jgi:hypothetical protein
MNGEIGVDKGNSGKQAWNQIATVGRIRSNGDIGIGRDDWIGI